MENNMNNEKTNSNSLFKVNLFKPSGLIFLASFFVLSYFSYKYFNIYSNQINYLNNNNIIFFVSNFVISIIISIITGKSLSNFYNQNENILLLPKENITKAKNKHISSNTTILFISLLSLGYFLSEFSKSTTDFFLILISVYLLCFSLYESLGEHLYIKSKIKS